MPTKVAVNGKHTLLYAHRVSPEKIDTLGISGKVRIHSVGFSFSSVSALPSVVKRKETPPVTARTPNPPSADPNRGQFQPEAL